MKRLALIAVLLCSGSLFSCSPSEDESTIESNVASIPLVDHVIADNTDLAPTDGRRIRIHTTNPDLSRDECIALINHYRSQAAPEGHVSVHKPSTILENTLNPWCVENFDGQGIQFHDQFFIETADVQTTDQTPAPTSEVMDYYLNLNVSNASSDTIIATVNTNLPEGSKILLTATRLYTEKGNTDDWGGDIYKEDISLSGTSFVRSIKVDDRIWINERNSRKNALESVGLWNEISRISDKVSVRAMFSTNRDQPLPVIEVLGGKAGVKMGGEHVSQYGRGKGLSSEIEVTVNVNK